MYNTSAIFKPFYDTSILINIGATSTSVAIDANYASDHMFFNIPIGLENIIKSIKSFINTSYSDIQRALNHKSNIDFSLQSLIKTHFSLLLLKIKDYIAPVLTNSNKTKIKIFGCDFEGLVPLCMQNFSNHSTELYISVLTPIVHQMNMESLGIHNS